MKCPYMIWVCPKETPIQVPCGKCLFCLSNKRNDWTIRLQQEQKASTSAHFVTLTYTQKYLPSCGLVKRHLQLLFKRLRKTEKKLRYYAVGEYGSTTGRAHYHIILFNLLDIENLRKCWTHPVTKEPLGIVHVGTVTQASCAYVTKYVIQKGSPIEGRTPPFSLMSRAFGIGAHYLTDAMVQYHRDNEANYYHDFEVKRRLPKFYKDKIWPRVKGIYLGATDWNYIKETVGKRWKKAAELEDIKNFDILLSEGYNPTKIQAEMRNAVESRINQKIAYTQTL